MRDMRALVCLMAAGTVCAQDWNAQLRVEKTGAVSFSGKSFFSSTRLRVRWQAPAGKPDHYAISATDGRTPLEIAAAGDAAEATIEELKSATAYTVRLRACLDAECAQSLESIEAAGSTEEESWRIVGEGNSFAGARKLIVDGNVNASALRYGDWAGPLEGKIQLYYVPQQGQEKGAKIAEMMTPRVESIESVTQFAPVSGYGLLRICDPQRCPPGTNLAAQLALFQPVPLAGGNVRLFFEAQASDGRTRVLYLDSQDGYVGRDFHRGAPTRCSSFEDYAPGGGCEPSIAIGVDVDGGAGNPLIPNARQFKIGWPNRDAATWDGAPGAWMWFTTEWQDRRCSDWPFNFAYAVWDGERWRVQYDGSGCPKLIQGAQAMAPMHLGGNRYKMYFNHHQDPRPAQGAVKPVRVIYSDAALASDPEQVDFEDWEPRERSRSVNFLWPDGTSLTAAQSSVFDDTFVYMPAGDPNLQVMYTNMSQPGGAIAPPFIGSAVLLNP
ncbi:MAG: fibronectin type III domain-containing protein [Acidobacteria bacterium]|nr:fibronectin type III domain-containing protein [Acidobacteriota bacterium]